MTRFSLQIRRGCGNHRSFRVMKKMAYFLLVFLMVAMPSFEAAGENLVPNNGFEEYVNGLLLDWNLDESAGANYRIASKGHSGERSFQIVKHPEKFRIFQHLHLEHELKYKLSVYMKSAGVRKRKKGFVTVIDSKWKWSSDRLFSDAPNSDWKEYSTEFYPNDSAHRLIIYKYDDFEGNLYFDDVTVSKVYTSASLALDIGDHFLKGKGAFNGTLGNTHNETGTFTINMTIADVRGEKVQNITKKVALTSETASEPFSFNYSVPNAGYYDVRFELVKGGKIVDIVSQNIEFKDIITIKPVNPNSRKLLKFPNTREIKVDVIFNKQIARECNVTLDIVSRSTARALVSEKQILPQGQDATFVLPVSRLRFGKYTIRAKLVDADNGRLVDKAEYPLDVLDPSNSTGFDKQNNLLVNGEKFFPMGFTGNMVYHSEMETLAKGGFNTLLFYAPYGIAKDSSGNSPIKLYLDQLEARGLKGIPYFSRLRKSQSKLQTIVAEISNHPSLLAYDIADEPSGGQPYTDFSNAYNWISNDDPAHPVTLVIATPSMTRVYKDTLDVVMADPYPNKVPKEPQRRVYDDVTAVRQMVEGKPVWDIPPTFGRERISNWPNVNFIFPTPQEMRNDYYLALVAGSKGLIGYAYNSYRAHQKYKVPRDYINYWEDPNRIFLPEENPEIWNVCKTVAGDLDTLKPFLFAPESTSPITIAPANESVHVLYKKWGDKQGILLVNSSKQGHAFTVTLPQTYTGDLSMPIAGKKLACANGTFSVTLGRYQDLYLEFEQRSLVNNGGFEDNLDDYTIKSGNAGSFELTSDTVYGGINALRITDHYDDAASLQQTVSGLEAGATYRLSALMKSEGVATPKHGFITVVNHDGSWQSDPLVPTQADTGWQEYCVEFTAQDARGCQIMIQKNKDFSGKLYLDEIRLTQITSP